MALIMIGIPSLFPIRKARLLLESKFSTSLDSQGPSYKEVAGNPDLSRYSATASMKELPAT